MCRYLNLDIGAKVKGLYMGEFQFTGIVQDKMHIYSRTFTKYLVKLDKPIDVFGNKLEEIVVNTKYDQSLTTSYPPYTDKIEEIKEN
jgi:hypothetical protein